MRVEVSTGACLVLTVFVLFCGRSTAEKKSPLMQRGSTDHSAVRRRIPLGISIYRIRRNAAFPMIDEFNGTTMEEDAMVEAGVGGQLAVMRRRNEEKKLLKKKRKQLKKLKEEVRLLNAQLNDGDDRRAMRGTTLMRPTKESGAVTPPTSRRNFATDERREETRWRKRILARVNSINRRLNRLEMQLAPRQQQKRLKQEKRVRKILRMGKEGAGGRSTMMTPTDEPKSTTTTHNAKLQRVYSSIHQSMNGEHGGACNGHKDCKPGLCCHRTTNGTAICSLHALDDGKECRDSCQCAPRLHCYRNSRPTESGDGENDVELVRRRHRMRNLR